MFHGFMNNPVLCLLSCITQNIQVTEGPHVGQPCHGIW